MPHFQGIINKACCEDKPNDSALYKYHDNIIMLGSVIHNEAGGYVSGRKPVGYAYLNRKNHQNSSEVVAPNSDNEISHYSTRNFIDNLNIGEDPVPIKSIIECLELSLQVLKDYSEGDPTNGADYWISPINYRFVYNKERVLGKKLPENERKNFRNYYHDNEKWARDKDKETLVQ